MGSGKRICIRDAGAHGHDPFPFHRNTHCRRSRKNKLQVTEFYLLDICLFLCIIFFISDLNGDDGEKYFHAANREEESGLKALPGSAGRKRASEPVSKKGSSQVETEMKRISRIRQGGSRAECPSLTGGGFYFWRDLNVKKRESCSCVQRRP